MSHDFARFAGTKRYVPTRLLGVGGMGAVYEVEDRATGGRVALKVMLADDAGRLLRFKQEFRVVAELHHPNLVRLFDLGQHDGQWFFTMELVHGQDLLAVLLHVDSPGIVTSDSTISPGPETVRLPAADRAADTPTPRRIACDLEALIRVVAQILDALEFLHRRGIVHRDVKPSNILVDLDGVVRLLDFGLASRLDREATISQEGAIVGTLAYLSPEQYRGDPASAASDLYALGCMMFQLITGELPFRGSPMEALAGRSSHPPPRIDERVVGAPPALVAIVHRLMARESIERPTLAEVRAALLGTGAGQQAVAEVRREDSVDIFVGRKRELSILAGCLEQAAGGQAQLALVSGPSGIGKSALGAMLARRAGRLGFTCLRGRCYEREQVPFVAFDRVIDELTLLLRRWSPERLASLRPSLLALERIFPALAILSEDARCNVGARPGADPRELRRQALDGFRDLMAHCQAEAPLCFILDDLQWADEESIALLSAMLTGAAGRIMVLGLFRAEGISAGHPLAQLHRNVSGAEHAAALPLEALGSTDAELLVQAVTRGSLEPGMSGALVIQAEGNPFLVRRLAEHLATLEPLEQTARLGAIGSAADLLRTMIQALSPRAENVLALAATAGRDIEATLLRATSTLSGEDFDLAVAELMAARVFKAVLPGPEGTATDGVVEALPRLDLYHDRIREVAYQGLPDDRRRALHRTLALAIEAQASGRGRDAEVLVHHFGRAGDRTQARRYAVEAAEQAAAKLSFVRAARLLRLVLDEPEPNAPPLVIAARWERAGDLFEYGGLHLDAARAYQEAGRCWDEAADHHPEREAARLRLRGLAGVNLMATEHLAEGRAAFESGLALLNLPLERPIHRRIAALAVLKGQNVVAERLADLGVRRLREPSAAAAVRFFDRLVRAFQPLWPAPAAEAALRAELLGRRIDEWTVLQRSLASSAIVPVFLGRCSPAQLEEAHLRLDAADELARAHDVALGRELVQLHRSLLWLATSAVRARRTCEAALAGFARSGMSESFDGAVSRVYYLYVLRIKGDDEDTLAATTRELTLSHGNFINVALALAERATLLARRGLCVEAREVQARARAHLAGAPPSRLDFAVARGALSTLVAEGRFAEALAAAPTHEHAARASGAWAMGFDRSLWLSLQLEAAVGLLRRRGLSPVDRDRARTSARWLAEQGVFDSGCLGHRALAHLEHAEGRSRASLSALRRALSLSSANTSPYHRWMCLEAARDLRAITLDQEAEAAELSEQGRFVLPVGWRRG